MQAKRQGSHAIHAPSVYVKRHGWMVLHSSQSASLSQPVVSGSNGEGPACLHNMGVGPRPRLKTSPDLQDRH